MKRLLTALLLFCLTGAAHAASTGVGLLFNGGTAPLAPGYYVATTGSDSNPGTLAQPFLTLGKAQIAMQSGLKITYLRAGTYAPGSAGTGCGDSQGAVLLLTSSDNGETWSYYPPDGYGSAVIDGGASGNSGVGWGICSSADNLVVNGLKFTNFQVSGITSTGSTPLIENNTIDGITNTVRATYEIGTTCALNGQIVHNVLLNSTEFGIGIFPNSAGCADNVVVSNNYGQNLCTAQYDCAGVYIENNLGEPETGQVVEYNYMTDLYAGTGGNGYYVDDGGSNVTLTLNVARPGGTDNYPCLNLHGGSNNVITGMICDLTVDSGKQIMVITNSSGTPTGNSFTESLILASSSGSNVGGGYPCNASPCGTTTIGPNGYLNTVGSSILATGSAGNDSNPQQQIAVTFTCGWEYTLPGGSPAYSSPVVGWSGHTYGAQPTVCPSS